MFFGKVEEKIKKKHNTRTPFLLSYLTLQKSVNPFQGYLLLLLKS